MLYWSKADVDARASLTRGDKMADEINAVAIDV
jgi:hypothetical protein